MRTCEYSGMGPTDGISYCFVCGCRLSITGQLIRSGSCETICNLQQQLTATRAELDMITGDRDEESRLHEMTKAKLKESELKRFARFANEECWIYMDHEENHLESLVCPVVISANKLQQILSELEAKNVELGPLRKMRETVSMAYRLLRKGRNDASKRWMSKFLREWAKATAAQKRTDQEEKDA